MNTGYSSFNLTFHKSHQNETFHPFEDICIPFQRTTHESEQDNNGVLGTSISAEKLEFYSTLD